MDMFITLIVMMVWVYAYFYTHQNVYIKYVQLFVYYVYLKDERKKPNIVTTRSLTKDNLTFE